MCIRDRYTTDSLSEAFFRLICGEAGVPVQLYANRADMVGGSTLGCIANTKVSVNTVDVGLAQLAMHSAMETAGADDTESVSYTHLDVYKRQIMVCNRMLRRISDVSQD